MTTRPSDRIRPGAWPVLFTPFTPTGAIDYDALDELAEFYVEAGVAGLFASCLSSEVFDLTRDERLEINRRLVRRVGGRVGIVAGGNFGATLEEQAAGLQEAYESGVDAWMPGWCLFPFCRLLRTWGTSWSACAT
jgi:4-hydroxy-tetrahydrodipicolinate synthase